ncbi:MAG TPA: MarR family transcriptional regulator [Nitrososphaerales archaeon]|nr:MarR family transcriptional regulator [Nitrososphaerales archaeon]
MSSNLENMREEESLSEKIADLIWEIWRTSKTASHPVWVGEVTPEQYSILRFLNTSGPQRVKDIATYIGTTASPVTISVKRLERQNLVKRERNTKDERVVTVQLTEEGKERFELWRLRRREAISVVFESLNQKEKKALLGLLQKVSLSNN